MWPTLSIQKPGWYPKFVREALKPLENNNFLACLSSIFFTFLLQDCRISQLLWETGESFGFSNESRVSQTLRSCSFESLQVHAQPPMLVGLGKGVGRGWKEPTWDGSSKLQSCSSVRFLQCPVGVWQVSQPVQPFSKHET